MANKDHLAILRDALKKGEISIWNKWCEATPGHADLRDTNLRGANLSGAYFMGADLRGANLNLTNLLGADLTLADLRDANLEYASLRDAYLSPADLSGADLSRADLSGAHLSGSYLSEAYLSGADLRGANLNLSHLHGAELSRADLSGADLSGAHLNRAYLMDAHLRDTDLSGAHLSLASLLGADLSNANLSGADLSNANLSGADLSGADFTTAIILDTIFANVDLSKAKNLDKVNHYGPSYIGFHTIQLSAGGIPDVFMRGCGLSDTYITYVHSLIGTAIDYYSCFISYSTADEDFTTLLYNTLQGAGIRCWFAPEEIKGGRKIHEQLYEAIRYHDKLILVLSGASMQSNWVELEIKRARKREVAEGRQVLFPIMLTDFENLQSWELITSDGEDLAEEIRQYFIPDFTNWKNHDEFIRSVDRLVNDLQKDE